jgi:hypothetical protein
LASASAPSTGLNARLGNMPPIDVEPSANGTYWPQDGKIGRSRYPMARRTNGKSWGLHGLAVEPKSCIE